MIWLALALVFQARTVTRPDARPRGPRRGLFRPAGGAEPSFSRCSTSYPPSRWTAAGCSGRSFRCSWAAPGPPDFAARAGHVVAFFFASHRADGGPPFLIRSRSSSSSRLPRRTPTCSLRETARSLTARSAMITSFEALSPDDTISAAANSPHPDEPSTSFRWSRTALLVGFHLPAGDLLGAERRRHGAQGSSRRMDREIPRVGLHAPLTEVLDAMAGATAPAVAVEDRAGAFLGYITRENIGEVMVVRGGRRKGRWRKACGIRSGGRRRAWGGVAGSPGGGAGRPLPWPVPPVPAQARDPGLSGRGRAVSRSGAEPARDETPRAGQPDGGRCDVRPFARSMTIAGLAQGKDWRARQRRRVPGRCHLPRLSGVLLFCGSGGRLCRTTPVPWVLHGSPPPPIIPSPPPLTSPREASRGRSGKRVDGAVNAARGGSRRRARALIVTRSGGEGATIPAAPVSVSRRSGFARIRRGRITEARNSVPAPGRGLARRQRVSSTGPHVAGSTFSATKASPMRDQNQTQPAVDEHFLFLAMRRQRVGVGNSPGISSKVVYMPIALRCGRTREGCCLRAVGPSRAEVSTRGQPIATPLAVQQPVGKTCRAEEKRCAVEVLCARAGFGRGGNAKGERERQPRG